MADEQRKRKKENPEPVNGYTKIKGIKMSLLTHIKKRDIRTREAGSSTALRKEIKDHSSARGLFPFAGVCI